MGVLRMLSIIREALVNSVAHTKSVAISIKISMISRAASRLSTAGAMVYGVAKILHNGNVTTLFTCGKVRYCDPVDARLPGRTRLFRLRRSIAHKVRRHGIEYSKFHHSTNRISGVHCLDALRIGGIPTVRA